MARNVIYAKFRTDKPADKGCSPELISVNVDTKYYDNFDAQPLTYKGCTTFLEHFERQ